MFNYRNEAAFSRAVCAHLKKKGYFVQRIETGSTGRGVPDIYCISPDGTALWLELKRVHTNAKGKLKVQIPWRPGQQAWLYAVSKIYKQKCYTLAAFNDCILLISHLTLHNEDMVIVRDCKIIFTISAL